jgi:hypothetical protein
MSNSTSSDSVEHSAQIIPIRSAPERVKSKSTKSKNSEEARNLAANILNDEQYRETLKRRLIAGNAPHMETLLWHYAFGKPTENVDFQGELTVTKIVREIIDVPRASYTDT